MASTEHIHALNQGVPRWNSWIAAYRLNHQGHRGTRHAGARRGVGGFWPDLSGAISEGMELSFGGASPFGDKVATNPCRDTTGERNDNRETRRYRRDRNAGG
jgi:hypothetical protein